MEMPKPDCALCTTRPWEMAEGSKNWMMAALALATSPVQGCTTAACTGASISTPNSTA